MKKLLKRMRKLVKRLDEIRALETMNDEEKEERKSLLVDIKTLNDEIRAQKEEDDLLAELDTSFQAPPAGEGDGSERRERNQVVDKPIYRSFAEQLQDIVTVDTRKASVSLKQKREAEERLQKANKRMEMRQEVDPNFMNETRAAGDGQVTNVYSDGGAFVQTDFATDIIDKGFNNSAILPKTQQRQLSGNSNSIEIVGIDESSRATGSRNGGVRVYTKAELEQLDASKAKFNNIELKVNKLTGLLYLSEEILEDASFLEGEVSDLFGSEFAFKIQDLIIRGSGAGEPLGILNAGCLVSQAKVTGQTADTITTANIVAMKARATGMAQFYANMDTMPQLDLLFKTAGDMDAKIFKSTGINTGILDGVPITFIEQCNTLGDAGDIILADFGSYVTVRKGGIKKAESMHLKFDYDQKAIKWTLRFDGQPRWRTALTPYKGTNTISPFVTLAARA